MGRLLKLMVVAVVVLACASWVGYAAQLAALQRPPASTASLPPSADPTAQHRGSSGAGGAGGTEASASEAGSLSTEGSGGGAGSSGGGNTGRSLAPLPTARATPAKGCPTDRLLYFGNANGRHSNQIRSVIHALHFGAYMNRTVVVPPFKQDKKEFRLDELYDVAPLHKVFCFVLEHEVFKGGATEAGCLERKGIPSKFPRQPKGGVRCARSVRMATRDIGDVVATADKLDAHRLVYMYETGYYRNLGPGCFWKHAEPARELAAEVARVLEAHRPVASVHLRGLERSCVGRLLKMIKKSGLAGQADATQCNPTVDYVRAAFAASGVAEGPVYLADDNQRPALTKTLREQLAQGAVSYAEVKDRKYSGGLFAMLVDFWILTKTAIFLPNQVWLGVGPAHVFSHAHYTLP